MKCVSVLRVCGFRLAPRAPIIAGPTAGVDASVNRGCWTFLPIRPDASALAAPVDTQPQPPAGAMERLVSAVRTRGIQAREDMERELRDAAPDTVKGRVRRVLNWLEMHVDSNEDMLRAAYASLRPADANSPNTAVLEVQHSGRSDEDIVIEQLLESCTSSLEHHHRMLFASLALTPLTALAGILPGPNVFFAWNAYRVYCHYTAWQGAGLLSKWLVAHVPPSVSSNKAPFKLQLEEHDGVGKLEDALGEFTIRSCDVSDYNAHERWRWPFSWQRMVDEHRRLQKERQDAVEHVCELENVAQQLHQLTIPKLDFQRHMQRLHAKHF